MTEGEQTKMDWISVNERLPDPEKRVICVTMSKRIIIACRTKHSVMREGGYKFYKVWELVTHWMPLPEPPKS